MQPAGSRTLSAGASVADLRPRVSASTFRRFKKCALELKNAEHNSLKHNTPLHKTRTAQAAQQDVQLDHEQIAMSQLPPGLEVEVGYSYVATTNLQEHGKTQPLCRLQLNGAINEPVLARQAAQLVCHEKYHRWRNQRLEALLKWFHTTHSNVLSDDVITKVKAATAEAVSIPELGHDNPAVRLLGMQHLAAMGKWLMPRETEGLLAKCVVKEYPAAMSEAEMWAQRRAGAMAASNKQQGANSEAEETAQGQGPSEAAETLDAASSTAGGTAAGNPKMPMFAPSLRPKQPGELTVEETRVQLLDGLIAWSDKDATFQQHLRVQIGQLELDARSLKMAADRLWADSHGDQKAWQGAEPADVKALQKLLDGELQPSKKDPYRNYRILLANRELKLAQLESLRRVKGTWGSACDHTDAVKSTFILEGKMTPGGFGLSIAVTCRVVGPELPFMLSKAPDKDFMKRFSSAGSPFMAPKTVDEMIEYELMPEREFPQRTAATMGKFIKLREIDSFHFSLPKDPPPPPSKAPAAAQPDPTSSSASAAASSDTNAEPAQSTTATPLRPALTQADPTLTPSSSSLPSTAETVEGAGSKQNHAADAKQGTGAQEAATSLASSQGPGVETTPAQSDSNQITAGDTTAATAGVADSKQAPDANPVAGLRPAKSDAVTNSKLTSLVPSDSSTASATPGSSSTSLDNGRAAAGMALAQTDTGKQGAEEAGQGEEEGSQEDGEAEEASAFVTKAGFEFGGSGQQLKQLVDGLQQYTDSTERRSLRWSPPQGPVRLRSLRRIPPQGPVRLQRYILPRRSPGIGDWHNLQVGGDFRRKEGGEPVPADGAPRSCYITNTHLTCMTDCLDELVRQQMGFLQLADIPPIPLPKPRSLAAAVLKAAFKGLSYVALATVIVAPVLAAFRGGSGAYQRQRAVPAAPGHALVQTADRGQAEAQAQLQAVGTEAEGVASIGYEAVNAHLTKEELDALCRKLEEKLAVPPQVRLTNQNVDVVGQPAVYQIVVDSSGEIYGCMSVNDAAVNLSASLPVTAQLRSAKYQQQYQAWLHKLDSAAEAGKSVEIPPPSASPVMSKPLPERPVVLRMSILIDHTPEADTNGLRTDLGMLSIYDQANDPSEMAQLINTEIEELRQSQGEGQSSDDRQTVADAEGVSGGNAGLQHKEANQDQKQKGQARSSAAHQGQKLSSAIRIVPWSDQDSQLLWT